MNTYQIGDNDQFMGGQAWEYYMQALVVKDCKELVNKINAAFFNEVLWTWKQGQNKINKMQGKYREEDKLVMSHVLIRLHGHGMNIVITF